MRVAAERGAASLNVAPRGNSSGGSSRQGGIATTGSEDSELSSEADEEPQRVGEANVTVTGGVPGGLTVGRGSHTRQNRCATRRSAVLAIGPKLASSHATVHRNMGI